MRVERQLTPSSLSANGQEIDIDERDRRQVGISGFRP